MVMLRIALNVAAKYDYIPKNPCRATKHPISNDMEVQTFTAEECVRIVQATMHGGDRQYVGVRIGLYTGLRIGEICGLKYDDIDFERYRLSATKSMKRVLNYGDGKTRSSVIVEEPKTAKSKRTIPIPRALCDFIARMRFENGGEYLVAPKNGKFVEPRRAFQYVYERLLSEAGVEYKNSIPCDINSLCRQSR
jgi:integrase